MLRLAKDVPQAQKAALKHPFATHHDIPVTSKKESALRFDNLKALTHNH